HVLQAVDCKVNVRSKEGLIELAREDAHPDLGDFSLRKLFSQRSDLDDLDLKARVRQAHRIRHPLGLPERQGAAACSDSQVFLCASHRASPVFPLPPSALVILLLNLRHDPGRKSRFRNATSVSLSPLRSRKLFSFSMGKWRSFLTSDAVSWSRMGWY